MIFLGARAHPIPLTPTVPRPLLTEILNAPLKIVFICLRFTQSNRTRVHKKARVLYATYSATFYTPT